MMKTRAPKSAPEPDLVFKVTSFVASFFWSTVVAALIYDQVFYLVLVAAIYTSIFIFSRSPKVKHGAVWSLPGVAFWYAFYWCDMLGAQFH